MSELRRKEFVNCSWCSTVKRRDTNEPVAEPLQTKLRMEIETHGMCGQCAADTRRGYPGKPHEAAETKNG
jgi:hypothetical protein